MEERAEMLENEGVEVGTRFGGAQRHPCCLSCSKCCLFIFRDVGAISILVTVALIIAGTLLLVVVKKSPSGIPSEVEELSRFVISAGVFGLAGGGTNALAVFMLLYKIPLLYGSG